VFPGSRKKALIALVCAVALVLVGVFLIRIGEPWGWLMVGFFGLAIPLALLALVLNHTYLKLDRSGVEIRTLWTPRRIKWNEVEAFFVTTRPGTRLVGIRFVDSYQGVEALRKVASFLSGVEAALPNQFRGSPEEICEKLNRWKQRFGS
jgi:hypothetical protein